MKPALYWAYSTRSLIRGGQRTVLAIFCVAVGVMAIIALQLVNLSVHQALLDNIVQANGGDMRVSADVAPLRQRDLAVFDQLKSNGRITDYATANDVGGSITLSTGDQQTFSFVAVSPNFPLIGQPNFLAPSPNRTMQQVVNGPYVAISSNVFTRLNAHIGSTFTVKTFDGRLVPIIVAAEFQEGGAFLGSQVIISQRALAAIPGPNGAAIPAQYGTVYMTVPAANLNSVRTQISQSLPSVAIITAQDLLKRRQSQVNQIETFLRIVGLLALFIGGVGIINTMQVLLRRRQVEIAMLKTTGYRQHDLYALFGLEAALLGIMGGMVGTATGVGASFLVRAVVENAFLLNLPVILDLWTIVSGLLIGIATALIFGLLPIVQASQVRPLAVLREMSEGRTVNSRLLTLALLVLLSLLFVILSASILGDIVTAAVAVYGGAIVVFALALGFSLLVLAISRLPVYERPSARILLWLLLALGIALAAGLICAGLALAGLTLNHLASGTSYAVVGMYSLVVLGGIGIILLGGSLVFLLAMLSNCLVMFLPRSWKTTVMLAYRNLGRQRIRTSTTLTALFVGVFAIGLVLILGQGIKDTINSTLSSLFTRNVFVVVPPRQAPSVLQQLAIGQGIDASKTIINPVVPQVYPLLVNGQDINSLLKIANASHKIDKADLLNALDSIEGFSLSEGMNNRPTLTLKLGRNLEITDVGTTNVVVSSLLEDAPAHLRLNDTIVVQSADGSLTKSLKIVGFYDDSAQNNNVNFASILADSNVTNQLGGSTTLDVFSLKVNPDQLPSFKRQVSRAVPSAIILSVIDIDAIINQVLNNLIIMLTTVASLAMVAGLIIIANAVALAMLERRREIGILKSVGHTSASVLATVMLENGLVGALGSLVAMLLVAGAITVLSSFVFHVTINVGTGLVALIIAATALVTMLVALLVAWQAVRVRPLDVLRYE